jgi:hypothetical protein
MQVLTLERSAALADEEPQAALVLQQAIIRFISVRELHAYEMLERSSIPN